MVASAAFFVANAQAQNSGTVTNHAFALGKGAGNTGYTSLLCGSAQLAVGQAAADPICRTITGDVTITSGGVTAIGSTKVTSAMLNADVFSTAHTWSGAQTFKKLGTTVYASQYGGADWCANLVLAVADLGSTPGLIIVDSSQTISACTAGSTILLGNNHVVQFVSGGVFTLNQTIQYGNYGSAVIGLSGGDQGNPPIAHGTVLKWTGGTGASMIYMFGTSFSYLGLIGLDCNSIANCTGINMNSNNSPISTRNVMERFEITGSHIGILIGSANTSATAGATCSGTPSTDGCSENDVFNIRQFQIFGNCADTTAVGIRINSLNAAQLSEITEGNIQCVNQGVYAINMNDNFAWSKLVVGSPQGVSPTAFVIGSAVVNGPDLINDECEGTIACIDDQASGGTQLWSQNQFNTAVSTTGGATILSASNTYSTLTVGGTVKMTSIGDTGSPTFSGSGRFITTGNIAPVAVASLPSCVSGRKGQSQYVTDANATTFNAIVAGAGANILRVGCDGTNWRIGG